MCTWKEFTILHSSWKLTQKNHEPNAKKKSKSCTVWIILYGLLDTVQKPQAMKERINKPDCIKIENFSSSCNLKKVQIPANHCEKIFLKAQLIKDRYPRYTKIFLNSAIGQWTNIFIFHILG